MDLIKFSVATTNVFPMANSKHGGQLTTEFNLRSRESVGTDSKVHYIIGPSYTHSLRDFLVTAGQTSGVYPGSSGQTTNNRTTVLTITEGRAVINGHYVESLAPITIDLSELNAELRKKSMEPLKGKLCIGIRIMYHTYYTMAGSIEQENDDDMYEGIHVVILPKSKFKLPSDVPENPDQVTAHLKLAEFTYNNGYISALEENKHRVEIMGMDRIGDAESALSDYFITRQGLDPGSHYVLSGKKLQENKGYWCRADNSLIEWDIATDTRLRTQSEIANIDDVPDPGNTKISKYKSEYAQFEIADREYHWAGSSKNQRDKLSHSPIQPGDVVLRMPHKQIDGYKSGAGEPMYFIDSRIPLINADYADRTPGIMTKDIIDRMHFIEDQIATYYRLPAGQMRAYIPILTDRSELPPIPLGKNKTTTSFTYTVLKDDTDTYLSIAEKFGVDVRYLYKLNKPDTHVSTVEISMNVDTLFDSIYLRRPNSSTWSPISELSPTSADVGYVLSVPVGSSLKVKNVDLVVDQPLYIIDVDNSSQTYVEPEGDVLFESDLQSDITLTLDNGLLILEESQPMSSKELIQKYHSVLSDISAANGDVDLGVALSMLRYEYRVHKGEAIHQYEGVPSNFDWDQFEIDSYGSEGHYGPSVGRLIVSRGDSVISEYLQYIPKNTVVTIPAQKLNYSSNKLSYNISVLNGEFARLRLSFRTLKSSLNSIIQQYTQTASAEAVGSAVASLEKKDGELDAVDAKLEEGLSNLKDSIAGLQEQINALIAKSDKDASSSSEESQDKDIKELQTRVTDLENSVNDLDTSLGVIRSTVNNHGVTITAIRAKLISIDESIDELVAFKDSINDTISEQIELHLESMKEDVGYYVQDVFDRISSDLNNTINNLVGRIRAEYNFVDGWKAGDYVLVGQDQTVGVVTDGRFPTTAYVVVPGFLAQSVGEGESPIDYLGKINLLIGYPYGINEASYTDFTKPTPGEIYDTLSDLKSVYKDALDTVKRTVPASCIWGAQIDYREIDETQAVQAENADSALEYIWNDGNSLISVRGTPHLDYLVASYKTTSEYDGSVTEDSFGNVFDSRYLYRIEEYTRYFYTPNYNRTDLEYNPDPLFITGQVPLASQDQVGGFLNVDSQELGNGYVYRDENGHLRLVDYDLLYSGVLAYQLGTDYSEGAGITLDDLQSIVDNYINNRIAFPTLEKLGNAVSAGYSLNQAYVIHLTITLNSDYEGSLNFYNIDSRFGTKVYLEFLGECDDKLTINVVNCERMRIYMGEDVNPNLKLDNVELWYSPDIMNRASSINQLRLWYDKFEDTDPEYEIDGMRVYSAQDPVPVEAVENFSTYDANDNHFAYAIRSMTFGSDGCPTDMELYITDSTTAVDLSDGDDISLFANTLALRQTSSFQFPETLMKHRLKVTGQFITAFKASESEEWTLKENQFTLLTNKNDGNNVVNDEYTLGTISILSKIQYVSAYTGDSAFKDQIDGWQPGRWHIFSGGRID